MKINRDWMIDRLKDAAALPLSYMELADCKLSGFGHSTRRARFIMPLTNRKLIRYAKNGKIREHIFKPGEVLICPAYAASQEVWNMPHDMISVVYYESHIRTLYIKHNGKPPDQRGPDIYFHTSRPLNLAGTHILHALLNMEPNTENARTCFRLLLDITTKALAEEQEVEISKELLTWQSITYYMEMNFRSNITGESIARAAKIHPAHLSRLLQKRAGCGVVKYINQLRLEYAIQLLKDPLISIGEIANSCGYSSANYFIRVFRCQYLESPAKFREKQLLKKNL